jgi:small subunit ribosomal protein S4
LELRLDNIVYRLGFAETRAQARQIVSHGMIQVDGEKVNIPSYKLKVGQVVAFRENKLKNKYVEALKQKIKNYQPQEWIESNTQNLTGKVLSIPTLEQFDNKINTQLIVELYSR